jgi:ubiquinone/menaquinone biosynthesis C-methylase UbiE
LRKIILRGVLYDLFIEPPLKKIKQWVARFIIQQELFPALDICCGTGKQCHLIADGRQDTFGLDLDCKMIQHASSKFPRISFACADAAHIPFQDKSMKSVVISYALHEKSQDLRIKILEEAKRVLSPEGKIILVDFEIPWNRKSRLGNLFISSIERMAGGEHYRNSRQFLKAGGLQALIQENRLHPVEKRALEPASSSIVVSEF